MATLIEVNNCDYPNFDALRDELITHNKFSSMSETYIKEKKYARFWVHDAKYIPLRWYRPNEYDDDGNLIGIGIIIHIPADYRHDVIRPAFEAMGK